MKVTRLPTGISSCFGPTPGAVIVIVGPPPGGSVVVGVGGEPPDPEGVDAPPHAPRQTVATTTRTCRLMPTHLTRTGNGSDHRSKSCARGWGASSRWPRSIRPWREVTPRVRPYRRRKAGRLARGGESR